MKTIDPVHIVHQKYLEPSQLPTSRAHSQHAGIKNKANAD
jgi:hypothetical protein